MATWDRLRLSRKAFKTSMAKLVLSEMKGRGVMMNCRTGTWVCVNKALPEVEEEPHAGEVES